MKEEIEIIDISDDEHANTEARSEQSSSATCAENREPVDPQQTPPALRQHRVQQHQFVEIPNIAGQILQGPPPLHRAPICRNNVDSSGQSKSIAAGSSLQLMNNEAQRGDGSTEVAGFFDRVNSRRTIECVVCGSLVVERLLLQHICEMHFWRYRPYLCGECDYLTGSVDVLSSAHLRQSNHKYGVENYKVYYEQNEYCEFMIKAIYRHCLMAHENGDSGKQMVLEKIKAVTQTLRELRTTKAETCVVNGPGSSGANGLVTVNNEAPNDSSSQVPLPQDSGIGMDGENMELGHEIDNGDGNKAPVRTQLAETAAVENTESPRPDQHANIRSPSGQLPNAQLPAGAVTMPRSQPAEEPRRNRARKTVVHPAKRVAASKSPPSVDTGTGVVIDIGQSTKSPRTASPRDVQVLDEIVLGSATETCESRGLTVEVEGGQSENATASVEEPGESGANGTIKNNGRQSESPASVTNCQQLTCCFCSMKMQHLGHLKDHGMRSHIAGYVPFKCTQLGCSFSTWRAPNMREHARSAHGQPLQGALTPSTMSEQQRGHLHKLVDSLDQKGVSCEELKKLLNFN